MLILTTILSPFRQSGYVFRKSTIEAAQETRQEAVRARAILTPSKTASLVRLETHSCDTVEIDHTLHKVSARLFHSLFRFALSHSFNCETRRGPTLYNGASCHCGECESGHAALTPNLLDDVLRNSIEELKSNPFNQITEIYQEYLRIQFGLTDEEIEKLSSDNQKSRMSYAAKVISRLTTYEQRGILVNTKTGFERNATFDNPRSSNKVDCHLERHLRKLEDTLASECAKDKKSPTQALQELQDKHRELLEIAIVNLKAKDISYTQFKLCFDKLLRLQAELGSPPDNDKFITYLKFIDEYLSAYEAFFKKHSGSPTFKMFHQHINDSQSPAVLKELSKYLVNGRIKEAQRYYLLHTVHLKIPADIDKHFSKAKREIENRQAEAENQLKVLQQNPEDIKQMLKYLFGEKDVDGSVQTPSRDQIGRQITRLLPTRTPTRSDLKKKDKVKPLTFEDSDIELPQDLTV